MNHKCFAFFPVFCEDIGKWRWLVNVYEHWEATGVIDARYYYTRKVL